MFHCHEWCPRAYGNANDEINDSFLRTSSPLNRNFKQVINDTVKSDVAFETDYSQSSKPKK